MGKRKAEVFTVVESVGNWFKARPYSPERIDKSTDMPTITGPVDNAWARTAELAETTNHPGLTDYPTVTDNEDPAADMAPPCVTPVEGVETSVAADVDDPTWAAHEAFWALL